MNHRRVAALLLAALAPAAAFAHPFHDTGASLLEGVRHPLTGLDHVLMILATGAWAALLKPAGRWLVAACLGSFVAAGALLPDAPLSASVLESAIALTVVGSGLLLAIGRRWPMWATGLVTALFATIHGLAHGAEGPASGALYVPGLALATAGLAITASFLAAWMQARRGWLRGSGVLAAAAGTAALLG